MSMIQDAFLQNNVERPRVKLPLPWFYNKPGLKLSPTNNPDMKNPLKVRPGPDQVSTKPRDGKFK